MIQTYIFIRKLFSSLFIALPVKQWHKRDDTYECKEADYISEIESDLFLLEGKLMQVVINRLLASKTSLSLEKVLQVCNILMAYVFYRI